MSDFWEQVDEKEQEISAIHYGLDSIPPLTKFKDLKSISFRQNHITEITNLTSSTLQEVDLYDNRISNISGFDATPNLVTLDLSFNVIRKIEHLEKLTKLQTLYLVSNKISVIENLNFDSLVYLELGDNRIRDISGLEGVPNLTCLWLGKNKIKDISGLSHLKQLKSLSLQSNYIEEIRGLEGLPLEELYLSENQITEIRNLPASLRTLDLGNNQIVKLDNLSHLPLADLWIGSNKIESFSELDKLPKSIKEVYFEHNPIQKDIQYRLKIKLCLPNVEKIDALYTK